MEEFNPLDFCPNIVDLMFQHLRICDLIATSEVSTDFWCFMNTYRKFVRNVKLEVGPKQNILEQDFINFLKNLRRNYENLEVYGNNVVPKFPLIVKHYKAPWKSVKISDMTFNRPTLLQNFINSVKNSLEELVISSVYVFNCDKKITMSLPQLKRLEMVEANDSGSFVKRVSFVINECKSLTILKLLHAGISEENQKKLLNENKNLKSLALTNLSDQFFESFVYGVNFKLERLVMQFTRDGRYFQKPNFNQFLRLLSENLESVELFGCIDIDVLETVFKMPKLKSLIIGKAKNCLLQLNLREIENRLKNSPLKELILTDDLTQYPIFWQIMLEKAPGLDRFVLYNSFYDTQ